jgi:hypothetical protein
MHTASPNAACPGLHRKPLDATIGLILPPYCPGGRQGDIKQNNNVKCVHFAGRFDGCGGALVLYRSHRPIKEVRGFPKSHQTTPSGKHLFQ